ncbi:MAG: fasciclin domain-containing protein [Candidatus Sumerlaeaceae bacterium]|nr:fasciclin domain-containing protein [Candidatus Sumerlaeaceae bacterium]
MKFTSFTKTMALAFALSLSVASLQAQSCSSTQGGGNDAAVAGGHKAEKSAKADKGKDEKDSKDIVDTAVAAGSFKTLVAAVKAADLVDTLKGDGPFTVFAPTDDAFAKLPKETLADLLKPENKEKLKAILTYHVVSGKVLAKDVKAGKVKTVNGKEITVTVADGKVKVDDAVVVKTDIETKNGVIHVIDAVIIPKE